MLEKLQKSVLLFIAICFLLPFVLLFLFNQPIGDDYCYAADLRSMGIFKSIIYYYSHWTGRIGGLVTITANPFLTNNIYVFKLFMFVIFMGFGCFIVLFYSKLFTNAKKIESFLFGAFFLALYLNYMPSTQQGIYWHNGFVSYVFPFIYLLAAFLLLQSSLAYRGLKVFFASLFIFLAVTSNEIFPFITFCFILLNVIRVYLEQKKIYKIDLYLGALVIAGLAAMLLSPGNGVRASSIQNPYIHDVGFSLKTSLMIFVKECYRWIGSNTMLWILSVLFVPVFLRHARSKNIRWFTLHPVFALLVLSIIPFILFLFYFASGNEPIPARFLNICYLLFLVFWFFLLSLTLNFLLKKGWVYNINIHPVLYVFLLGMLFVNIKDNNIRIAYSDLVSKKAIRFDAEMNRRQAVLLDKTTTDTICVNAIEYPQTICAGDITPDANDWRNKCYSAYFYKKQIIICE